MSRGNKIILIISAAVLVICLAYLGKYTYDSNKALEHFDELEEIAEHQGTEDDGERENVFNYTKEPDGRLKCYSELHSRNSDMVGWISIPDTQVSYPVMQQKDNNSFYLNHNFDKQKQSGGLPMLDYQCSMTEPSSNLIVYGHNMRNGSVFATLVKYKKKDFFEAHKLITLDSVYEHRIYRVIGVFNTKVGSAKEFKYHLETKLDTPESFDAYCKKVKGLSLYDTGENAEFGDELITLSTCSYGTSNERMVVVAKRIS